MSDTNDVVVSPVMLELQTLLAKEFPTCKLGVGKHGIDVSSAEDTRGWGSSVELRPEHERKYYYSTPDAGAKIVAIQVTFEGKQRSTTRYPVNPNGSFNTVKLVARVREGLETIKQRKLSDERRMAALTEVGVQRALLEKELEAAGKTSWHYGFDLVRSERDGKVSYSGKIDFRNLPFETVKELIRLSGRDNS
jgi:hypothetical protein